MKIVAISDTHNAHKQIKAFKDINSLGEEVTPMGGDIIIHAGDATGRGYSGEVESFLKWFGELDFSHRIYTPGNHDWLFEKEPARAKELCEKYGVTLLIDESIIIDGVKIHASPVSPWFHDWAFNRARHQREADFLNSRKSRDGGYHIPFTPLIKPHWDKIPDDTNILVTHGPPYEILDELMNFEGNFNGQHVGCEELLKKVRQVKPDIHIFGHIHCSHGSKSLNGTTFYNVSICDEAYGPVNPVTVIDYEKE